jgi:putative membrane protein
MNPDTATKQTQDDARIRDHLANERTYLAWLRTGIATMGFGVVIAKLRWLFPAGALSPPSRGIVHASNIGLLFTIVGLLTVALSIQRYLVVQRQIRESRYESSGAFLIVYAAIITLLGLLIVWYLVTSSRLP